MLANYITFTNHEIMFYLEEADMADNPLDGGDRCEDAMMDHY